MRSAHAQRSGLPILRPAVAPAALLPRYEISGKTYLTIAIGCTGGRHRSVYVAERLARGWEADGAESRIAISRHRPTPDRRVRRRS